VRPHGSSNRVRQLSFNHDVPHERYATRMRHALSDSPKAREMVVRRTFQRRGLRIERMRHTAHSPGVGLFFIWDDHGRLVRLPNCEPVIDGGGAKHASHLTKAHGTLGIGYQLEELARFAAQMIAGMRNGLSFEQERKLSAKGLG
jgi:hypothetical protein